jgi:hypothetical protein
MTAGVVGANDAVSKRRRVSADLRLPLLAFPLSAPSRPLPPLSAYFKTSRRARLLLDDLPEELGVIIVDGLGIEARANFTLCNTITANWVSKSLIVKIGRCESDDEEGETREETRQRPLRFSSCSRLAPLLPHIAPPTRRPY